MFCLVEKDETQVYLKNENEQTTFHNYTFNRLSNQEMEILLEKSLSS